MPPEDSFDALHSAVQVFARPRPVPYRNDRAPRPLPRTMRPPEARANDPRLAWDEQSRALAELQRNRDMGRTALEGQAQAVVDPEHTPLENGVLGVARAYGPGAAYDAVRAGARVANGDRGALGDLALNTGIAALPFLGVRGLRGEPNPMMRTRGEPAPMPMREPLPAEAPRPVAPSAGGERPGRWVTLSNGSTIWRSEEALPRPVTPDAGSVRDGQFNTDEVLYRGDGNNVGQQEGENAFWYTPHRATAAEFGPNITAAHVRGRLHVFDAGGRSYEDINVPQILDSARGQGFAGVRFRNMLDEAIHDSSNAPYPDYVAMFDRSNVHPVAPDGGGAGAPTATERYPFGFRPVSDEPWAQSRLRTDQFYPVDTARDYGDAVHAPEIAPTDVPVDSLVGTQESIGSRFLNRPSTGNEPVSVYRAEDGQMYIIDGHHRVAGAVARGEPTVSARVYSPENPPINTREPEIQAALDARLRPEFDGGQWHIVENGQRLRTLPQGTTARDAMRAADEMRSARTPPPTDPKSLPRRKPPSGGFTVFGAPR